MSPDPILGKYLDSVGKGNQNNGVFDSKNLALYSYGYQNPVRMLDPDGNAPVEGNQGGSPGLIPEPEQKVPADVAGIMRDQAYRSIKALPDFFGRSVFFTQAMKIINTNRVGNGSGITVIGKLWRGEDGGYKQKGERLKANYLDIPDEIWNNMSKAEQQTVNDQFIDYRAQRRDIFILNIPYEEAVVDKGKLGTEVHRLQTKYQYQYDSKTNALIPPPARE